MTTARTPSRRPGRWTLVSGVALICVGVLSFNAYAAFTATANYDQDIGTGTMSIILDDEASATIAYNLAGAELAAGDTMQRAMSLTFGGTVAAQSLTLSLGASTTDLTDTGGMTLKIDACATFWVETDNGGIPTYASCDSAGAITAVLAETELAAIIATPEVMTANLDLAGENHLRLTWKLPATAGNTFQDLDETVAVTLASNQRAATNK